MSSDLSKRKTFLLCGHAHSGKTTLADALLFKIKASTRFGKVDDGTSVSDYEEDEKERKSSINLSVLNGEHKGFSLQFVDVPGYLDFIGELISASRAVDFAVIVVDSPSGIAVGTEKAWDILRKEEIPCVFFINKLDKENTDFQKTVNEIRDNLTKKAIPFASFDSGKVSTVLNDKNSPFYSQIAETVAESNDALLEKYLDSGTIDDKEMGPALKNAIINSQIFPIIAGVALEEVGVDELLSTILEIMPSVSEAKPRKAKKKDQEVLIEPKEDAPLAAQVFKTLIDPYVGQLTIFRVFSGSISSNGEFYNATKGSKEKIGQLYMLQGKQQAPKEIIGAGQIGAVAKLKNTETSDTLCGSSDSLEFPPLEFPSPAFSASVKPKTRKDEDKISSALTRLTSEDPTFSVSVDSQTKEQIISGMGELHLHVIIDRMQKKYGVGVDLGTPKVPYKESIAKAIKVQGKHKKQSGGRGQYGDVWIEVEPLERGKNFEFVNKIVGGAIPRNFIPSVEKGIRNAMNEGILAGFPMADIKITLYDGSYHDVDSSDMAFQIAGSLAIKKAMEQAGAVLLEPIMNVEIVVPEEFMGQVTGDINSRRGKVLGMDSKGKNGIVKALVPLAEMFKYASDLRSVTGGRGSYVMSFSSYEVVPARIAQTIISEAKTAKADQEK